MRRVRAAAVLLALTATACSSEGAPTTTTAGPTTTSTTLLAPGTTTTLPPRAVTAVDVCALLRPAEVERLVDEPGPGEPEPTDERDQGDGVPALVTGSCSWPSRADTRLSLHYLAPTTARDGVAHLQDVLAADTGFAEGGRVVPQTVGNLEMGVLVDGDGHLREVAAVNGSALLYFLVDQEVDANDPRALAEHTRILRAALVRAPR